MKLKCLLIIAILGLFSCQTTKVKENEMKFTQTKLSFDFTINSKNVSGEIESFKNRHQIVAKIDNDAITGEVINYGDRLNYSLIYKNEFVKGAFNNGTKSINFLVTGKKLTGEFSNYGSQCFYNLNFENNPLKYVWTYDKSKSLINWNISSGNKESSISIKENLNFLQYDFSNAGLEEDEILIFLILEIQRMQK
jgi:hypothetical protein